MLRVRLHQWLAVLFVLQTVGFVALVLREGTSIGSTLFLKLHLPEGATRAIDLGGAGLTAVCAVGLVFLSVAGRVLAPSRNAGEFMVGALLLSGFSAGWMLLESLLRVSEGGQFGSMLAPIAQAVRWGTPLAIGALAIGADPSVVLRWLRMAAGLVFVAHGLECLFGHPLFTDFLIIVPGRYLGHGQLSQPTAETILLLIGGLDVVVGVLFARRYRPGLALWMTGWGFLTASVRLLYFGSVGWPDAMIRVTNGGVPLMIWGASFRSQRK